MQTRQTQWLLSTAFLLCFLALPRHSAHAAADRPPQAVADANAITALMRAAADSRMRGAYDSAIRQLEQARALAAGSNDPGLPATLANALGGAYLLLPDTARAAPLLDEALRVARERKDAALLAAVHDNLARLARLRGAPGEAAEHHRLALRHARADGAPALLAAVATNGAQYWLETGALPAASDSLAQAGAAAAVLPDDRDTAWQLLRIGHLQQQLAASDHGAENNLQRAAYASLQRAVRLAVAAEDGRAAAWAWGYLAGLYAAQQRSAEALELSERAMLALQGQHAPEILFRWQWLRARLLAGQGDIAHALDAYRGAIDTLHAVRTELAASLERSGESYHRLVGPLYLEYADLLLGSSERTEDADAARHTLREARHAIELLKTVELQDYFQDDCVSLARARVRGLDETLSAGTAVIYPILFPDRTELLLSTRDGLTRHPVTVTAAEMTRVVRDFRRKLEKRTTRQFMRPARQLYDWLIRPLEPELDRHGIDTLVIVPDAALRTIPLAALHDGENFLVTRFALASTPSLELTDPRPLEAHGIDLLLGGLTESVQGYPALPSVAAELDQIRALYGGDLLENSGFSTTAFRAAVTGHPYSVVHIASHGEFAGRVSDSFILTHDGRLSMGDLERDIGLSQIRVDSPVELLTLSACQTAAGDDWAGLGLASVAIRAGARSALATLWYVNDRVTADLVTDFYRRLGQDGMTKARALQLAQRAILADVRYRHPAYWAPYLLIGNWQ